ncbi:MAG: hypothetical protein K0S80_3070 [Neobacillus sp.]|nr:hypothetical protein [Neobacillus sp.]
MNNKTTEKKEIMKVLTVGFNFENKRIETEVVEFENNESNLKDYYHIIGCDCNDIVNYSQEIAIIVDDEGLLKSDNPVFELFNNNDNPLQLAGKLVFTKNHYGDDGISQVGFCLGDLVELLVNLKIRLIRVTA